MYVGRGKGDVYNKCYYIIYKYFSKYNTYNNYYVKDYYQNLHQSLPEKHMNGNLDVACVSSPLDNQRQSLVPASGYFGDCVT